MITMGRTLASYRMVLENERKNWNIFKKILRGKDPQYFNELWNHAFQLADAASVNTRPLPFENILMSMLLGQQREIHGLQKRIKQLESK